MINLFVWLFLAGLLCWQHFVCITTPRQSVMVITRRRNLEKVGSYWVFVWECEWILFFARSVSLMELYGPDIIVLLMNLWVSNGVVKDGVVWSYMLWFEFFWDLLVLNGWGIDGDGVKWNFFFFFFFEKNFD